MSLHSVCWLVIVAHFLVTVHHLNSPVGRLNSKSQQHVASNDMTNVDSTSFTFTFIFTFRLPVCGCELVRVCAGMCVFCLGNKLLIIIWKELQRWWGPAAELGFSLLLACLLDWRFRFYAQDFCGILACGWFPGLTCMHISMWISMPFRAEKTGRVGTETGECGVVNGYSLSKLTFVRAQDLCINVPSILPICVCSFQMCITTTTTTLRCVFFLLFSSLLS